MAGQQPENSGHSPGRDRGWQERASFSIDNPEDGKESPRSVGGHEAPDQTVFDLTMDYSDEDTLLDWERFENLRSFKCWGMDCSFVAKFCPSMPCSPKKWCHRLSNKQRKLLTIGISVFSGLFMLLIVTTVMLNLLPEQSLPPGLGPSPSPAPGGDGILAMVAGYTGDLDNNSTTVEIWDGQSWSRTSSLSDGRRDFEMVKLLDGRVMAAGGSVVSRVVGSVAQTSTEIWDPADRKWHSSGGMLVGGARNFSRQDFRMIVLGDGSVLAVGGWYPTGSIQSPAQNSATAELWDPADKRWTKTGSMAFERTGNIQMVLLKNGSVLVVGGAILSGSNPPAAEFSSELYDPSTGRFSLTGNTTFKTPYNLALGGLANGSVLATGWSKEDSELWDPETGKWSASGPLTMLSYDAHMVPIKNGTELFLTSRDSHNYTTTQLWEPKGGGEWKRAGAFKQPAFTRKAGLLSDNRVLAVGVPLAMPGPNSKSQDRLFLNATLSAEIFDPITQTCSLAGNLTSLNLFASIKGNTYMSGEFRLVTF